MDRNKDWLEEVWAIKEELSKDAQKMGLIAYLRYVEQETDKILLKRRVKSEKRLPEEVV